MDGLERAALPELHASVHAAMLIVPTRGPVQLWFARVEARVEGNVTWAEACDDFLTALCSNIFSPRPLPQV